MMSSESNRINPWVRADTERVDLSTEALILDFEQPLYERLLQRKLEAGTKLNELLGQVYIAQAEFDDASQAQQDFFRRHTG